MDERVRAAFARIPLLGRDALGAASVTPLASLSARAWRVEVRSTHYVLRLPARTPGGGADEMRAAEAAGRAGIGPRVLFSDPADGLSLVEFLDDCRPMSAAALAADPGALARAARVLRAWHDGAAVLERRMDPFATVDALFETLERRAAPIPAQAHECRAALAAPRHRVRTRSRPVPCHGDPVCANFLDDGRRMRLVDWEYAAMGDPTWDLAELALDAELTRADEDRLLDAYAGGTATSDLRERVRLYRPLCDLTGALWALERAAAPLPSRPELAAYAATRLARAHTALAACSGPRRPRAPETRRLR